MRVVLLWFGVLLYVAGVVAVLLSVVMSYGDGAQLQALPAPVWHLAPVMLVIGVGLLTLWRRLPKVVD